MAKKKPRNDMYVHLSTNPTENDSQQRIKKIAERESVKRSVRNVGV